MQHVQSWLNIVAPDHNSYIPPSNNATHQIDLGAFIFHIDAKQSVQSVCECVCADSIVAVDFSVPHSALFFFINNFRQHFHFGFLNIVRHSYNTTRIGNYIICGLSADVFPFSILCHCWHFLCVRFILYQVIVTTKTVLGLCVLVYTYILN